MIPHWRVGQLLAYLLEQGVSSDLLARASDAAQAADPADPFPGNTQQVYILLEGLE